VPDLILTKQQYSFKTKLPLMRWMVLLGRGNGAFSSPIEFRNLAESRSDPRYSFALADVNGDKKPDVLFSGRSSRTTDRYRAKCYKAETSCVGDETCGCGGR
jgi:hypothetical protein